MLLLASLSVIYTIKSKLRGKIMSAPFTRGEIVELPGLIDVHAHLRQPGGEEMETIATGTNAALYGGYVLVADMPNNPNGNETWTAARATEKHVIAAGTANTDFAVIHGHDFDSPRVDEYPALALLSIANKSYFGHTTGNTAERTIDDPNVRLALSQMAIASRELGVKNPSMLHARETVGHSAARYIIEELGHPVHWCHVSTATEVRYAEILQEMHPDMFTAGVTPHHLTMTSRDADFQNGWNARMMPPLGKEADAEALLWGYNKGILSILETDHAPHSEEKKLHAEAMNPEGYVDPNDENCVSCFGVSGIEFVLPIMAGLVQRKQTTMERLVDSLHTQPLRMLGLEDRYKNAVTTVEFEPWQITEANLRGRSNNTPYLGFMAGAKVRDVSVGGVSRFMHPNGSAPKIRVITPKHDWVSI